MSLWLSFTKTIPLLIINFDYFTINISLNIPYFSFQSRNEIDAALGKYKEIASIQTDIAELWNNIGLCFFKKQKLIVVSGQGWAELAWGGVEWKVVQLIFPLEIVVDDLSTEAVASAGHEISIANIIIDWLIDVLTSMQFYF